MNCPTCGNEVYDNRQRIREEGWKGPVFKCKDPSCGWLQWPPKAKPVTKVASGPGMPDRAETPTARQPKWTWPTLSETYLQSLLIARKQVVGLATSLKLEVRLEDILSAAHTVFIAASRDGVKLQAVSRVPDEEEEDVTA